MGKSPLICRASNMVKLPSFDSNLDLDLAPDHPKWKRLNRHDGGKRHHLPGSNVEARAVEGTLDDVPVELALGKRRLLVGADVADRIEIIVDVEDGDRHAVHVEVLSFAYRHLVGASDSDPLRHSAYLPPIFDEMTSRS